MRVARKCAIAFLSIIICILLMAGLTLRTYRQINRSSVQLRERIQPHVVFAMQLYQGIVDLDHWGLTYVLNGQPEQRRKIESIIDQLHANVAQNVAYEQKSDSMIRQAMAQEIQVKVDRYLAVLQDILEARQNAQEASDTFPQKYSEYQTALNNLLSQLGEYRSMLLGDITTAYNNIDKEYAAGKNLILASSLIAILLAATASVVLTFKIVRPIQTLHQATDIIGQGDLNHRIEIQSPDELGQLAQAFNQMVDRLRATLVSIDDLDQAKREADAANTTKSRFLANVSHEIRTPLNAVISMAKLLHKNEAKNLTPQQVEQSEIVYQGSQRLLALINNVLDISKIEAGKMTVEQETVSMEKLLHQIEQLARGQLDRPTVTFNLHQADSVPRTFLSDEHKLQTILTNLVDNAIKFTPSGSVSLKVSVWQGQLCFRVSDTGIGIPPDQLSQVFEEFTQGQEAPSSTRKGTGLGLTLTKHMTELMGGSIDLVSTPGQGTTVTVYLPMVCTSASPSHNRIASSDSIDSPSRSQPLILIAEDDEFSRAAMRLMLEDHYELVFAVNGQDAIERYREVSPDLVFMDIMMPVMDGTEALAALAREPQNHRPPVIALTAKAMTDERETLLAQGFTDYLSKPIDDEQLFDCIQRHLAPSERQA